MIEAADLSLRPSVALMEEVVVAVVEETAE
jgi:hypothetical protein